MALEKSVAERASRATFASAALLTYLSQLGGAVLSLANVLIVARALGPVGRGDVAFLTTIAYLTAQLCALGVGPAHANLAGQEPKTRRALAGNSIVLALLLGVGGAVAVAGLVALFPGIAGESESSLRWVALGSIPLLVFQSYLIFLVQADYGFSAANLAFVLVPVVSVVTNGLLAAFGVISVGTALAAWIGGQALATFVLASYLQRRLAGFGRPSWPLARRALGFGVKAHAGRVMLLGNYRLDQWFVGAIAGSRELGLYSVAVAWAEALYYLPTALVAVQRPDLVRARSRDAGHRAAAVFRGAIVLTLPLAVGMIIAAPVLCATIFGDDFRGSIDDLRTLAAGAFGIIALKLLGSALTAQGKPMLETGAIAAAFAATLVLDIVLIPPYGGLGAALASTLAYTTGGIAVAFIFSRALRSPVRGLVPGAGDVRLMWRHARLQPRTAGDREDRTLEGSATEGSAERPP